MYSDSRSGGTTAFGISLNGSPTTNVDALAAANLLAISSISVAASTFWISAVARLAVNDVIYAHDKGANDGTTAYQMFRIVRVG